jgi:23S rRNA (cytosine1962-C5)-methyltransferase
MMTFDVVINMAMQRFKSIGTVILKKNREKSLLRKHPWVFSGAIQSVKDVTINGQLVRVLSAGGEVLGMACISLHSQIRARMLTFTGDPIGQDLFTVRIAGAFEKRQKLHIPVTTNAFRLINAESDLLPGLVVDVYDRTLVCQFLSAGMEYFIEQVVEALHEVVNPVGIYERSDAEARVKEGLEKRTGILKGKDPVDRLQIREHGIQFFLNIKDGHKTGFYLDQRDNRKILESHCRDAEVLNCFSYTGGFGLSALAGGARHVTNIDSSDNALGLAMENAKLNGFNPSVFQNISGDVFKELRSFRDAGRYFDVIILDPPKFAESASQLEKASRGYKDINLLAMKLIRPGGLLFTFSCSGHMVPELFRKIIADAAVDAGREVQLVQTLQQAADHPILMSFPESFYLKGLICRVW